jgi:multisubunit Na+/H+ antiporter MnhB subunit
VRPPGDHYWLNYTAVTKAWQSNMQSARLTRLLVIGMLAAMRAILLKLQPVPVIHLVLVGVIVSPLAFGTSEGDHRSFISSHFSNPVSRNIKDGQAAQ